MDPWPEIPEVKPVVVGHEHVQAQIESLGKRVCKLEQSLQTDSYRAARLAKEVEKLIPGSLAERVETLEKIASVVFAEDANEGKWYLALDARVEKLEVEVKCQHNCLHELLTGDLNRWMTATDSRLDKLERDNEMPGDVEARLRQAEAKLAQEELPQERRP